MKNIIENAAKLVCAQFTNKVSFDIIQTIVITNLRPKYWRALFV